MGDRISVLQKIVEKLQVRNCEKMRKNCKMDYNRKHLDGSMEVRLPKPIIFSKRKIKMAWIKTIINGNSHHNFLIDITKAENNTGDPCVVKFSFAGEFTETYRILYAAKNIVEISIMCEGGKVIKPKELLSLSLFEDVTTAPKAKIQKGEKGNMEGILEVRFKRPVDFSGQPYNQNPEHWLRVNEIYVKIESDNIWNLACCIDNVKVESDTADPCLVRFFLYFEPSNMFGDMHEIRSLLGVRLLCKQNGKLVKPEKLVRFCFFEDVTTEPTVIVPEDTELIHHNLDKDGCEWTLVYEFTQKSCQECSIKQYRYIS
jgi:hypothetical protein